MRTDRPAAGSPTARPAGSAPANPPAAGRPSAATLLAQARAGLDRLEPAAAFAAVRDEGALLVDVRVAAQRAADGEVPGAIRHSLNHLEWRVDQTAETPDPAFAGAETKRIVVLCDGGYASSLAAARLQAIGFPLATDLVGGFQAWRAAGLPVDAPAHTPGPPDVAAS